MTELVMCFHIRLKEAGLSMDVGKIEIMRERGERRAESGYRREK